LRWGHSSHIAWSSCFSLNRLRDEAGMRVTESGRIIVEGEREERPTALGRFRAPPEDSFKCHFGRRVSSTDSTGRDHVGGGSIPVGSCRRQESSTKPCGAEKPIRQPPPVIMACGRWGPVREGTPPSQFRMKGGSPEPLRLSLRSKPIRSPGKPLNRRHNVRYKRVGNGANAADCRF